MTHRHLWLIPLVALTCVASGCGAGKAHTTTNAATTANAASSAHPTKVSYAGKDGSTALQLLRKNAQVKTKHSSLGDYVVSIDGTAATKSKYWMFYVDGKAATKGANAYRTHNGEKIEWRYES